MRVKSKKDIQHVIVICILFSIVTFGLVNAEDEDERSEKIQQQGQSDNSVASCVLGWCSDFKKLAAQQKYEQKGQSGYLTKFVKTALKPLNDKSQEEIDSRYDKYNESVDTLEKNYWSKYLNNDLSSEVGGRRPKYTQIVPTDEWGNPLPPRRYRGLNWCGEFLRQAGCESDEPEHETEEYEYESNTKYGYGTSVGYKTQPPKALGGTKIIKTQGDEPPEKDNRVCIRHQVKKIRDQISPASKRIEASRQYRLENDEQDLKKKTPKIFQDEQRQLFTKIGTDKQLKIEAKQKMETLQKLEAKRKMEAIEKRQAIEKMEAKRKMEAIQKTEYQRKMEAFRQMEYQQKLEALQKLEHKRKMEALQKMESKRKVGDQKMEIKKDTEIGVGHVDKPYLSWYSQPANEHKVKIILKQHATYPKKIEPIVHTEVPRIPVKSQSTSWFQSSWHSNLPKTIVDRPLSEQKRTSPKLMLSKYVTPTDPKKSIIPLARPKPTKTNTHWYTNLPPAITERPKYIPDTPPEPKEIEPPWYSRFTGSSEETKTSKSGSWFSWGKGDSKVDPPMITKMDHYEMPKQKQCTNMLSTIAEFTRFNKNKRPKPLNADHPWYAKLPPTLYERPEVPRPARPKGEPYKKVQLSGTVEPHPRMPSHWCTAAMRMVSEKKRRAFSDDRWRNARIRFPFLPTHRTPPKVQPRWCSGLFNGTKWAKYYYGKEYEENTT